MLLGLFASATKMLDVELTLRMHASLPWMLCVPCMLLQVLQVLQQLQASSHVSSMLLSVHQVGEPTADQQRCSD